MLIAERPARETYTRIPTFALRGQSETDRVCFRVKFASNDCFESVVTLELLTK